MFDGRRVAALRNIESPQREKTTEGVDMAEKFYCKWCGQSYSSVATLTATSCSRNPEGKKHELYEGSEKSQYTCKYCGQKYSSLSTLTATSCSKSPHKKHHPAM
jgi:transcription elongation factor Elf1